MEPSGLTDANAGAQTPPAPCSASQSHAFDFWIGDWDVFAPSGKLAGTNRIERIYGCVLHESWKADKIEGKFRVVPEGFPIFWGVKRT